MAACEPNTVQAIRNLADEYGTHADVCERVADDPRLSGLMRSVLLSTATYLSALRWALEECADARGTGPLDELVGLANDWLGERLVTAGEPATVGEVTAELMRMADDGCPFNPDEE